MPSEGYRAADRRVLVAAADRAAAAGWSLCHEGGYSSGYVPFCGLAIVERLAGVATGVADPWLDEARTVAALPLRDHEAAAIDVAAEVASRAWPRSLSR